MGSHRFKRARAGFTLLELLVVVAIMGLLAALLLPALARAKGQSHAVYCNSNLREWGGAFRMYADDNNDFLPRRGQGVQPLTEIDRPTDWFNALPIYFDLLSFDEMVTNNMTPAAHTESVFICPDADNSGGTYFLPYGMNMNLCPWNLAAPTKFADVLVPTVVVAMGEAPGPYASTFPSANAYGCAARHANHINLLFLAGEVNCFAAAYAGCGVGDIEQPDVHWLTGTASDASSSNY